MPEILKNDARRMLGDVPDEFIFKCCDGRTMTNMLELRRVLTTMKDEVFHYHVNPAKNDFASWVKYILKDEKLASDLLRESNRKLAAKKVAERLAFLEKTLE